MKASRDFDPQIGMPACRNEKNCKKKRGLWLWCGGATNVQGARKREKDLI